MCFRGKRCVVSICKSPSLFSMTRVFCNGKLFLREKNAPPSFFMCAFFLSLFFASKRLYVFRVLEVFFWCARALSRQTKKKLSLKVDCIHFRSLFLFAFKTTFYARSCSLAQKRESLLPKKKRNTNTRKVLLF